MKRSECDFGTAFGLGWYTGWVFLLVRSFELFAVSCFVKLLQILYRFCNPFLEILPVQIVTFGVFVDSGGFFVVLNLSVGVVLLRGSSVVVLFAFRSVPHLDRSVVFECLLYPSNGLLSGSAVGEPSVFSCAIRCCTLKWRLLSSIDKIAEESLFFRIFVAN